MHEHLPVSNRMGSVRNNSERSVSLKTTWYTPASDAVNVEEIEVVSRPLVPSRLVGVNLIGCPSLSHNVDGTS